MYIKVGIVMSIRDFTYNSYQELLNLIIISGYNICNYHTHTAFKNPCIIRHDIDYDIEKAVKLAETESSFQKQEIHSTYFVLLTSNLYNTFEKNNTKHLKKVISFGHEIGLHFDETYYFNNPSTNNYHEKIIEYILKEKNILEQIIESPVSSVSMHNPSKYILELNLEIPGILNSYSNLFFKEFKYLSDSWHNWRENAEEIVSSKKFEKLHLLTHPIWYTDSQNNMRNKLFNFVSTRNQKVYDEIDKTTKHCNPPFSEIIARSEI